MKYTLDAVDSYKSVLKENNSADNQVVRDKANFVYIVSRMCARCGMVITPHLYASRIVLHLISIVILSITRAVL
jgi:hypothetical protein